MEFSVEITDNMVFIGEECSSGCKYPYTNKQDIINAVTEYIENYVNII